MSNKHINEVFEALTPTEKQENKMFSNIVTQKQKTKKHITRFLSAPVAFCLIVLMAITVFAATNLGLDKMIVSFLHPTNEQAELLASGALNVNKKIVQKNGTLEITQVIGDSNQLYIFMRFIAPEGTVLNAERYAFDSFKSGFNIDGISSNYGYGWISIPDENPNDNVIDFVMTINSEISTMGHKISLDMEDLCAAAPLPDEFKCVLTGKWNTSFNLDYKDTSRTYTPAQAVKVYDYDATVESITLSPISITMEFSSANLKSIRDITAQIENKYPITILYKDGTSETTTQLSFSVSHGNNAVFFVTSFESVVNDKEISAISFFDVTIPIE